MCRISCMLVPKKKRHQHTRGRLSIPPQKPPRPKARHSPRPPVQNLYISHQQALSSNLTLSWTILNHFIGPHRGAGLEILKPVKARFWSKIQKTRDHPEASISVLKNRIFNWDPGRSWGPPHLGCLEEVWTPQPLRFQGLDPPNVEVSRFGPPKR